MTLTQKLLPLFLIAAISAPLISHAADDLEPWMDLGKFTALQREAAQRSEAQSNGRSQPGEDTMSATMRAGIRPAYLAIKTPADLQNFLNKLEKEYPTYKDLDAKIYAINAVLLKDFRSIIWKLRPLTRQAKINYTLMVGLMQLAAGFQTTFLPSSEYEAGFAYITEPFSRKDKQITTIEQFQDFLGGVAASLEKALGELEKIQLTESLTFDAQLLYGKANFQSDIVDRYFFYGKPEYYSMLSGYYGALHNIAVFRAYRFPEFMQEVAEFAKIVGVNTLSWKDDGMQAKERAKIIKQFSAVNGKINGQAGYDLMKKAGRYLIGSVRTADLAWIELKNRSASHYTIFDSAAVSAWQLNRGTDLAFENLLAMLNGEKQIRSTLSDETVTVNLPAFYLNPPDDLNNLMPYAFVGDDCSPLDKLTKKECREEIRKFIGLDEYRNYHLGKPAKWNGGLWGRYIRGATDANVGDKVRTLSQAWGGAGSLITLFLVI